MSRQGIRKKVKKEAQQLLSSLLGTNFNDVNIPATVTENSYEVVDSNIVQKMDIDINSESQHDQIKDPLFLASSSYGLSTMESDECEKITQSDKVNFKSKEKEEDLKTFLSVWSIKHSITVRAMNELLSKLKIFDESLPVDVRTLRETPRQTKIIEIDKGTYFHYGLENSLMDFLFQTKICNNIDKLILNFGIDGLPLFKSSKKCLWPVMMSVFNHKSVFMIGVYINVDINNSVDKYNKPNDPNKFLKYLCDDLRYYTENGFLFNDKLYQIETGHFVCDAPARAFLLNIKSHSGFYCCTKCTQKGQYYQRRITFPESTAETRTDDSFRNRSQTEHHTKQEPLILESIGIGCVSQFPLDYMYVVCLGVAKQLVKLWIRKKGQIYTLTNDQILAISNSNVLLSKQFCTEFNRVPRTLMEFDRWKATEHRSFLLYSSIVVLQNILNEQVYSHFCKLHIAIRILCDANLCTIYNDEADNLLNEFISELPNLYGQGILTYNIHSLSHLAQDVVKYGSLEQFSAFKYENYLFQLKQKVKSGSNVLTQISNRLIEESFCIRSNSFTPSFPILKGFIKDSFYKSVTTANAKHSIIQPDNIVESEGNLYMIRAVKKTSDDVILISNKINNLQYFFNLDPNLSRSLGIYKTERDIVCSDEEFPLPLSITLRKYVKLQLDSIAVFFTTFVKWKTQFHKFSAAYHEDVNNSTNAIDQETSISIKTLLLTIADQNKAILDDNRCLKNSLTLICDRHKKIAEQQMKFEEEHKKNIDTIYKLQSHIAEEFIQLRTSVDTAMRSLRNLNSPNFLPEISTPDDILRFDAQIKDDDNIKSQLIKKFGSQPCDDIRKFVIQNLKLIFIDDTIASKFSWSITKNNISVKDYYFIKILKDVANEKIPQTTNSTVEGHIKAYFNSSKDRLNKKLKRQHDCI